MNWLDVAGFPGSGKSTICDSLWGPHELPIDNKLPPLEWMDFCNEITRLFLLIQKHPTFPAALRMNNRSIRKMATVVRARQNGRPYVQTGLVQRGLGFGWRMSTLGIDMNELRHYFRVMPVSIGVAFTKIDPEIVKQRNRARGLVRETAHEVRDHMIDPMLPAIDIALEALRERGVPVLEVDTTQPIQDARTQLVDFSNKGPCDAAQARFSSKVSILSPPAWWQ